MARRQRALTGLLQRFQAYRALPPCEEAWLPGNRNLIAALIYVRREDTNMRWKISHHGHDPRQIDLLAVLALLIVIVAAYLYFSHKPEVPNPTAFIVPGQSVRW
jgi:hypothetical protein